MFLSMKDLAQAAEQAEAQQQEAAQAEAAAAAAALPVHTRAVNWIRARPLWQLALGVVGIVGGVSYYKSHQ